MEREELITWAKSEVDYRGSDWRVAQAVMSLDKELKRLEQLEVQTEVNSIKHRYESNVIPPEAIECASRAAAEYMDYGMGALHVGSHVLLSLINHGHVTLRTAHE